MINHMEQISSDAMLKYVYESRDAIRLIIHHALYVACAEKLAERSFRRIYLVGSGTSYHACIGAAKLVQTVMGIETTCSYPMEFVDNMDVIDSNALLIGVSQAGRSASTIQALDKAKKHQLVTCAITADMNAPICDHVDLVVPLDIGEETVGPKTKGYIGSIAVLDLLAIEIAQRLGKINIETKSQLIQRLLKITDSITEIADATEMWFQNNQQLFKDAKRFIVIGYGPIMSSMLEGSLKMLEANRCSVTGYELEEFMHGIYHSIDSDTWIFGLGYPSRHYERMVRMMKYLEEEKEAQVFMIPSQRPNGFHWDFVNDDMFSSMEYTVPLQVLAREISLLHGIDCTKSADPDFHKKMQSYIY